MTIDLEASDFMATHRGRTTSASLLDGQAVPAGQPGYFLRPALRITDLAEHGTIVGSVADALVLDGSCVNDLAEQTGNLVYVYAGADVAPVDIDGTEPDPLATAQVLQNPDAADGLAFAGVQNISVTVDSTSVADS